MRAAAVVAIAQAVAFGMLRAHFVDRRARARRRQQRGLPAQGHGAERDQETVAVLAQVDRVAGVGQQLRQAAHVREESVERQLAAGTQRDRERAVAARSEEHTSEPQYIMRISYAHFFL